MSRNKTGLYTVSIGHRFERLKVTGIGTKLRLQVTGVEKKVRLEVTGVDTTLRIEVTGEL